MTNHPLGRFRREGTGDPSQYTTETKPGFTRNTIRRKNQETNEIIKSCVFYFLAQRAFFHRSSKILLHGLFADWNELLLFLPPISQMITEKSNANFGESVSSVAKFEFMKK